MKSLLKFVVGTAIITTYSFTPAYSQEPVDEAIGDRKLSIGIGFADSVQEFQGRIGLGVGIFPEYDGSDDFGLTVLPLAEIRKPGAFFVKGANINPNDGLVSAGVTIFHFTYSGRSGRTTQLLMGPLVRVHGGRDEGDNKVLDGLRDIDTSVGIGGFMELNAGHWSANLAAAPQDVGDDQDGLLVVLDTEYSASVSNDLTISTGLSASWANDDYMQGYFGITDAQSAQTGLTRFDSEAGFKDIGVQMKATYALSRNWLLDGQVGYWRLLNDAADSPIVDVEGSANQVRGLVGLSYRF